MTGLFIALDEYIIDPIEEEVMRAIRAEMIEEEYFFIPSISNRPDWDKPGRPRNSANLHSM